MSKLGKRLISAAKEANKIARGEADPKTYKVHVPPDIDVAAIRKPLKLSQDQFAMRFGIPVSSIRDYEQGRATPPSAIRAYLKVIEKNPRAVEKALENA